jgi:hypothetical protein
MKGTQELLVALLKISALLATVFKDGIQAQDFAAVVAKIESDDSLKSALLAAYNDIEGVPAEFKSISVVELFDLLKNVLPEVLNVYQAIAAPAPVKPAA